MNTHLDCIPCLLKQALHAARLATKVEKIHAAVIHSVLKEMIVIDPCLPPPAIATRIYGIIRKITGMEDPYREDKEAWNSFVLQLYPRLKSLIVHSPKPFETALRLAIAGNIIDFGPRSHISEEDVHNTIIQAFTRKVAGDINEFASAITSARKILYIGDNAGEIVFDRLFIEQLPQGKIIFSVRGAPVINDATMADAEAVGMTKIVAVIDNGTDAPGTIVEKCSEDFRRHLAEADLVIAKGQGNYESLSGMDLVAGKIYFIFMVKCRVVAKHIGLDIGSLALNKA